MTGLVLTLHQYNPYLIFLSGAIVMIWSFVQYFRKSGVTRPLAIGMYIAVGLAALQGLLGLIMVASGLKPGGGSNLYYLHYVYGAIVIFAIPVATTYASSGKKPRTDALIYGIAALILVAAAARAFMTGPATM
ncbi:hypothetical protein KSC_083200 [Ktedonobacter sp. SOSP1-52]|uniref:COX15/CtaA family protein n=1 Tax=Ktedonobacter sp. SOSP1-52 TaxID=2778366 RepID=UPI001914FA45|nr:COX15/CtaA family protein [Ktedonobacter sp. SOSP1-52]GHO69428.1 hypothetical protein KSC_083200 [Ktedonobacter sp. SOSP1-52]